MINTEMVHDFDEGIKNEHSKNEEKVKQQPILWWNTMCNETTFGSNE